MRPTHKPATEIRLFECLTGPRWGRRAGNGRIRAGLLVVAMGVAFSVGQGATAELSEQGREYTMHTSSEVSELPDV